MTPIESTQRTSTIVESFFSRLKQTFGFNFRNKSEVNREKELRLKCYLLNKFTDIGMRNGYMNLS
ncbi:hypothetical protein [Wolbachia endosymbiont of Oedothorax gibbosus]|uniref:hypothetical protein n=1 Tax=Wolbachia endosymbiont of Oedothorax gibbosus TaxID=931100 RepID=UPI00202413E9|nr:hypothetical protein [Wolbachia endosymbiont of Oedothorax gibbosus]